MAMWWVKDGMSPYRWLHRVLPVGKTPLLPIRMLEKTRLGRHSCHGVIKKTHTNQHWVCACDGKETLTLSLPASVCNAPGFDMFVTCLEVDGEVSRSSIVGSLYMWLLSCPRPVSYSSTHWGATRCLQYSVCPPLITGQALSPSRGGMSVFFSFRSPPVLPLQWPFLLPTTSGIFCSSQESWVWPPLCSTQPFVFRYQNAIITHWLNIDNTLCCPILSDVNEVPSKVLQSKRGEKRMRQIS